MKRIRHTLLFFVCLAVIVSISSLEVSSGMPVDSGQNTQEKPGSMEQINSRIALMYSAGNSDGLITIADSLIKSLRSTSPDRATLSEIYYHIGVSLLLANKYNEAVTWLNLCMSIKEDIEIADKHYANSIYNIGVAYNYLGDFSRVVGHMKKYIAVASKLYGEYSPDVAGAFSTLVSASLEKKDYAGFREYTARTLDILNANKDALVGSELTRFYVNVGAGYARLADHAKARIYFEEAESIYNVHNLQHDHNYINLINSLAIVYGNLGLTDKENRYYQRGMELAVSGNSFLAFNLINSFAVELARSGQISRGEEMITDLVERAKKVYGPDSRFYIDALKNHAAYLSLYMQDYGKSIHLYLACLEYVDKHAGEVALREPVMSGYARALLKNGQGSDALEMIQRLLFYGNDKAQAAGKYENPQLSDLRTDRSMISVLRIKHDILKQLFSESGDRELLENAALTSELIISLIDRIRISISEDESRVILGDRYRDSYLLAIHDFELCYRHTGEERFLEKTFEFAEKSKVAGLLAATRELNAVNFHIPADIAELEKSLQREIAFCNSEISKENGKESPDMNLISEWNKSLLAAVEVRDSLILAYERDYPGYYAIKYATDVLSLKDVLRVTGRNTNYLNYVMSDSLLYIFLVNRKHRMVVPLQIDSAFSLRLREFRYLLSNSDLPANARSKFDSYRDIGYGLYKTLIEPVREYFISDDLLISPDNILSYLPFETFLTSSYRGEGIVYRNLPFLMNDLSISYAYSATLMKETTGRKYRRTRNLVAFAPLYTRAIYTDSISSKRESGQEILYDLPYARMEAEYVTKLSNGTLYINENAKESVFKAEAGRYDIIHLAMHTWLNDRNPMASAMIFTRNEDRQEDGLLNTFEVYGLPLKAKMVVLSSCNTGSGLLSSGEGILSLARGFLYSGSRSVVMSMWEIEDRSGTDIVKMFYDELMKGKSKSSALIKARRKYLENASQLKSHPYFWSSLVVYGDNSPVYQRRIIPIILIPALIIILLASFFLYRKYS